MDGLNIEGALQKPLWWDTAFGGAVRPRLAADTDVDVAIIGAGFTGLWTAYYLARLDPTLRVAVIESEHVGFGASGRNGGWCHAQHPLGVGTLASDHGKTVAVRFAKALFETVDEVGTVVAAEAIDCGYTKGGVAILARSELQYANAEEAVRESLELGFEPDDLRLMDTAESTSLVNATSTRGGTFSPHAAAVDPARLVHGLASAVEKYGVTIYEQTTVSEIRSGEVTTDLGRIGAEVIIRATEAYTSDLPGQRRAMVPLYSLMVATEPLSDDVWQEIGLTTRPVFSDFRHLVIYGQRTDDGRLAFGGRGAPYHWGSGIRPDFDVDDSVHEAIRNTLVELFPAVGDARITHRWGGPLGAPRDWRPAVVYDRSSGIGWAGGYVGDGVATANLAGRTLADLILGRETDLTTLPWVDHAWPKWEPEPLRWIGINAGLWLTKGADAAEARTGRPSLRAKMGDWMRGK